MGSIGGEAERVAEIRMWEEMESDKRLRKMTRELMMFIRNWRSWLKYKWSI